MKWETELINDLSRAIKAIIQECYECEDCQGTGNMPESEDACRTCGGYGWNPRGDIREAIQNAKELIGE